MVGKCRIGSTHTHFKKILFRKGKLYCMLVGASAFVFWFGNVHLGCRRESSVAVLQRRAKGELCNENNYMCFIVRSW